jgi:hypothetical protein
VFFSGRLRLNRQKQSGRIFIQPLSNSEESANYFFAAFFAFFFFFMAAMIVFLMMSVAVGRWSTLSVADLVLGLAPYREMTMTQRLDAHKTENGKSLYISVA